ncbi:MAG: hypothetical protein AABY05_02760 [Nanoarchaeota archaeon]
MGQEITYRFAKLGPNTHGLVGRDQQGHETSYPVTVNFVFGRGLHRVDFIDPVTNAGVRVGPFSKEESNLRIDDAYEGKTRLTRSPVSHFTGYSDSMRSALPTLPRNRVDLLDRSIDHLMARSGVRGDYNFNRERLLLSLV